MNKDELKRKIEDNHNHFKEVAENYVNECWGSYLDLNYVDLVLAGIGVGKIIALEEEKRIAELEEKLEQTEKDLADYQFNYSTIKELQKENAELKEEINKIAFARGNLEEENAELKNNNKVYCEGNGETLVVNVSFDSFTRINANHKMYYPHKSVKDIEKENAELKQINSETLAQLNLDNGELITELTKAKEIIKKFSEFVNNEVEYDPEHPQEHTDLWNKLCEEAEQFLSEVEK